MSDKVGTMNAFVVFKHPNGGPRIYSLIASYFSHTVYVLSQQSLNSSHHH